MPTAEMKRFRLRSSTCAILMIGFFVIVLALHFTDFRNFHGKEEQKDVSSVKRVKPNVVEFEELSGEKHEVKKKGKTKEVKLAPVRPNIDDLVAPRWLRPLDFRIICVVFDRAHSLERLLNSLNTVDYLGDKVLVEVWIDRSKKDGSIDPGTYTTASKFQFKHGDYMVRNHTRHVGIYGQWMGTWNPAPDSHEIVVILEDDITASPHLYRWLKNVHKKFDHRKDIAGFSLQGRSMKHNGAPGNLRAPEGHFCMLYPVVGSWGFSPNRENWFKYIEWYKNASKDLTKSPLVKGILPSQWYQIFIKRGRTESMWTMWHIYYTHLHKQYTLYPSLPNIQGLTINWQESGLHYQKSQTKKNADPLLLKWDPIYDNLPDEPVKLDYGGKVIK